MIIHFQTKLSTEQKMLIWQKIVLASDFFYEYKHALRILALAAFVCFNTESIFNFSLSCHKVGIAWSHNCKLLLYFKCPIYPTILQGAFL